MPDSTTNDRKGGRWVSNRWYWTVNTILALNGILAVIIWVNHH